jgi:hypothetical protein
VVHTRRRDSAVRMDRKESTHDTMPPPSRMLRFAKNRSAADWLSSCAGCELAAGLGDAEASAGGSGGSAMAGQGRAGLAEWCAAVRDCRSEINVVTTGRAHVHWSALCQWACFKRLSCPYLHCARGYLRSRILFDWLLELHTITGRSLVRKSEREETQGHAASALQCARAACR